MKIGLLLCFLFFVHKAYPQQLSKEQTLHDLEFLIHQIETYNPALDKYTPDFRKKAQALLTTVPDSVSLLEYFALVSQVAALSNEGHFLLGQATDTIHKGFINNTYSHLPLRVYVIDNKIYVRENYGEDSLLQPLSQITAINGHSAAQILEQLYRHIPSDGYIETNLEVKASQAFSWKYYLYIEQPQQFEMQVLPPNSQDTLSISCPALTRAEQVAIFQQKKKKTASTPSQASMKDFYELSIQEHYALLTLKSFSRRLVLDALKLHPKKIYKHIFKELEAAQVKHLIVDLRGHTGGRSEFARGLVPFITKVSTKEEREQSVSWKGKIKTHNLPAPHALAFEGQLYGLVDGQTFSSGAVTARYLREYGQAIMLGEETATRYEGFVAGSYEYIYLPHTHIRLGISRYHQQFPLSEKQATSNRGLIPDVIVYNTIEDIQKGYDRVLARAIALIKAPSNQQQ